MWGIFYTGGSGSKGVPHNLQITVRFYDTVKSDAVKQKVLERSACKHKNVALEYNRIEYTLFHVGLAYKGPYDESFNFTLSIWVINW